MRDKERLAMRAANARRAWAAAVEAVEAKGWKVSAEFIPMEHAPEHFPEGVIATTSWGVKGFDHRWGDEEAERKIPLIGAWLDSPYWDDPQRGEEKLYDKMNSGTTDWRRVLIHEIGHTLMTRPTKFMEHVREAMTNPETLKLGTPDVVLRVSGYAMESPAEYVAEVFAGLVLGRKYDDEVMKLYHWLGGEDAPRQDAEVELKA